MFPVLITPNEPVHFLGFLTSWIRIRIPGGKSLYGSGSKTLVFQGTGKSGDKKVSNCSTKEEWKEYNRSCEKSNQN